MAGTIEFPIGRAVVSIFECSGSYFLMYDEDQSGKYWVIEPINDPRLGGTMKAKFVPTTTFPYGFCSIKSAGPGAVNESKSIRLLKNDAQMTVDLRKVRPFEVRLVSKDGSFLLDLKWSGKPGERNREIIGFVVLHVDR